MYVNTKIQNTNNRKYNTKNMHNVTAYTEINVITIKEENSVRLVGEIFFAAFNGLIYYPDNNLAHSG